MNNPNQKPYDKNDNDTYVEKYSPGMVRDVEMHMFRNEKSHVYSGGMFGNFSTESRIAASNNVLHFQKATNLGLKLLKEAKMPTLVPYSLMKRYESELFNIEYSQKTPVFFDIHNEKFVIAMDERVLRDLGNSSEFEKDIKNIDGVQIRSVDFGDQILISYNSMHDLMSDTSKIYKNVKSAYLKHMLTLYPSDDVIITSYRLESDKKGYFSTKEMHSGYVRECDMPKVDMENSNISFEFFKARKVAENTFYIYDKDGVLNTSSTIYLNKEKAKEDNKANDRLTQSMSIFLQENHFHTVCKYTDEDWSALVTMRRNIADVFKDLEAILLNQKTNDHLDKPISEIDVDEYLKLDFNKPKSIGLKR